MAAAHTSYAAAIALQLQARARSMAMDHLQYSYIAMPTTAQVSSFLRALASHGVSISHLGKSDPPRKFRGSIDDAVSMMFSGTDLWTFARDAARKLDFDFQIRDDPPWTPAFHRPIAVMAGSKSRIPASPRHIAG